MMQKDHLTLLDPIVSTLYVEVYQSGAVKVQGCIQDKQYALNLLDAARTAILNYHDKPVVIPNAV